jgi:hypothetical protein
VHSVHHFYMIFNQVPWNELPIVGCLPVCCLKNYTCYMCVIAIATIFLFCFFLIIALLLIVHKSSLILQWSPPADWHLHSGFDDGHPQSLLDIHDQFSEVTSPDAFICRFVSA